MFLKIFLTYINRTRDSVTDLNPYIVQLLKDMLDEHNPLAQSFKMARDRLQLEDSANVKLRLIQNWITDARNYILPTTSKIASLIVGDIDMANSKQVIIIETQSRDLQRIDELHPSYLGLEYPFCSLMEKMDS